MKIEFILTGGALATKGLNFEKSGEYDVPEGIAEYLVKTFSGNFKLKSAKIEPKAAAKEDEVKVESVEEVKVEPVVQKVQGKSKK